MYRYNFQDLIQKKSSLRLAQTETKPDRFIAEVMTSRPHLYTSIPAPQGIGEHKHHIIKNDKTPPQLHQRKKSIKQVQTKDNTWSTDTTHEHFPYQEYTKFKPPLYLRKKMEAEIQKRKKAGMPCPFTDKNHHCSALFLRCGDREQFATPETLEQQNLPHTCLYTPEKDKPFILIVDKSDTIRVFCKNAIELFLNYPSSKIITRSSTDQIIPVLTTFKTEKKLCGLLISEITESDLTDTHSFLHTLYERNHALEVILLISNNETAKKVKNCHNTAAVYPYISLVRKILLKPFHSDEFIEALKTIPRITFIP